jgi:hypothetical protein
MSVTRAARELGTSRAIILELVEALCLKRTSKARYAGRLFICLRWEELPLLRTSLAERREKSHPKDMVSIYAAAQILGGYPLLVEALARRAGVPVFERGPADRRRGRLIRRSDLDRLKPIVEAWLRRPRLLPAKRLQRPASKRP